MIFEFLLPIIGWLVLFGIFFVIYSNMFYKEKVGHVVAEGQALYTALASFFWITVYMCLSSVWSILYSLIDLKYPDIVSAASDYGNSGFAGSGVVFDAFAFPLSMTVVSSVTALILGFWLISKFQTNKNLRPQKLYLFMRALVFVGGAVLAFSGFVYVVYSWLYGNLPVAVFMKGAVAFGIVGSIALYFYLVADGKNPKEGIISRVFAGLLVVMTILTLVFSFKVIGTPAEARLYRLDSITLQNLSTVQMEVDQQMRNYSNKITELSQIDSFYVKSAMKNTSMTYTTTETEYTLCSDFNSDMPKTINIENRDTTWDYKKGNSCFTFSFPKVQVNSFPKGDFNSGGVSFPELSK